MDAYGSMVDVPDLIKRTQAVGRELLRKFVYLHSTRLTAVVRRSLTSADWLTYSEPRDVRVIVQILLEDVSQIRKLVACTLGDWDARSVVAAAQAFGVGSKHIASMPALSPAAASSASNPFGPSNPFAASPAPSSLRTGPAAGANPAVLAIAQATRRTGVIVGAGGSASTGSNLSGIGSGGARGAMQLDIDRLFRSGETTSNVKIVLGAVDYTSDSVTKILLRCIFKALVEWIRTCTLNTAAYQQVQIDVGALHLALPFFTSPPPPSPSSITATSNASGGFDPYSGASILEELLNEAAITAAERCLDPKPLESTIIYKVASEKLSALQVAL
jgi:hypothetical protein